MAKAEIHRGAVPERIAQDGEPRCTAIAAHLADNVTSNEFYRCAYKEGHEGPHYRAGAIW